MQSKKTISEQLLCTWMIDAVARLARVDPTSLGPATAFEDLGLSSLAAVTLTAELSDAFGVEVDALVTWDYPTIGEVARAISAGVVGTPHAG
jgi:acyl carrier protein